MNFYTALNQGDASLKEPHLTSILYYIFQQTHIVYQENSFINYFIKNYLPNLKFSCYNFDVKDHLKIEEILIYKNKRRDADITLYIKNSEENTIINIENKIFNSSYDSSQVLEQDVILKLKHPNAKIENILILPYISDKLIIEKNENLKLIYWIGDNDSLTSKLIEYFNNLFLYQNISIELKAKYLSIIDFINAFSQDKEQEQLSEENLTRGPKNKYQSSMYEYLLNIATNWNTKFPINPDNVKVKQLIKKFEEDVLLDNPNLSDDMIQKFKKGALEAQPKIMTINEKNRIHFNVKNPQEKNLFYYPDFPYGDYTDRWKNIRIKPLSLMNEQDNYIIYWKNLETNEIQKDIFNQINS